MKIVNSPEMERIDKETQKQYCIPEIVLMENAGIKIYNTLLNKVWNNKVTEKTVFIAGKGNNGGDALVMARQHYITGGKCSVIIPDSRFKDGSALINYNSCKALGIDIYNWEQEKKKASSILKTSEWIIEGLSGTGLKGELGGRPAEIANFINKLSAKICSIDIPSGVGDSYKTSYCCVNADLTLTPGLPKFALYTPAGRKKCGRIITVPIGFPPQLLESSNLKDNLLSFNDLKKIIKPPSPYTYKNKKGHTVVFAGSPGMNGAAVLCASAALNSLSGLVTLKTSNDDSTASLPPSVITGTEEYISFTPLSLEKYNAAAIGPGWGLSKKKKDWLKSFLEKSNIPCVIDADALNLLSEILSKGFKIRNKKCIITPHIGEFSRLTGISQEEIQENPQIIADFAAKHNITVVLKSHVIWISSPEKIFAVIDGSNSALATAGSGDILTGIMAALLSYGLAPQNAATGGVLLHQYSGLICYRETGFFKSEKLIEYTGKALKKVFEPGDLY